MRKLNKTYLITAKLMIGFWAVTSPNWAFSEKADRDKPTHVEADRVTVDDLKQVSVFEGNVVLTRGTLLLRANKVIVKQDAESNQYYSAYGNPINFKQKREGVEEYVEGYAERLEYDGKTEQVKLFDQARLKRNADEVRGNTIFYDTNTEFYQVDGGKGLSNQSEGRVKAVIQPKRSGTNKQAIKPSGQTSLKPAAELANPPKE